MIFKRDSHGWTETDHVGSGVKSHISWTRLTQELKKSGEIKETEKITQFEVSHSGITYKVEDA